MPSRSSPPGQPGNVVPFRRRSGRWWTAALIVLPLAAFSAVLLWDGSPRVQAASLFSPQPSALSARSTDRESAAFAACAGPLRGTCVVDGDTIWYRGEKIRIADINAPEVSEPDCAAEAALGANATRRLTQLLNAGPFTLEPTGRSTDQHGRSLYVITRQGESLGGQLVSEGLAEEWQGYRLDWCG